MSVERWRLRGRAVEIAGKPSERQVGLAGNCGELMKGRDVAALRRQGVERGLLLLDFRLQHVGRIGLADIGELARGLRSIGGDGAQLLARVDLLLQRERGVEAALNVGFDGLLLRGPREHIGALLLAINIAAQAELAAQRDGLLDEAALLTASVGAAANLIALIADHRIRKQTSLLRPPGALGDGGLRGAQRWIVDAGGCEQII